MEIDSLMRLWKSPAVIETVKTIVYALLIVSVVLTFIFRPYVIPSSSMKDTLLVGDYVFVTKFSYGYSKYSFFFSPNIFSGRIWGADPERGDVVVFRKPSQPDVDYIKRVGLGSDDAPGRGRQRRADMTERRKGEFKSSGIDRSGKFSKGK